MNQPPCGELAKRVSEAGLKRPATRGDQATLQRSPRLDGEPRLAGTLSLTARRQRGTATHALAPTTLPLESRRLGQSLRKPNLLACGETGQSPGPQRGLLPWLSTSTVPPWSEPQGCGVAPLPAASPGDSQLPLLQREPPPNGESDLAKGGRWAGRRWRSGYPWGTPSSPPYSPPTAGLPIELSFTTSCPGPSFPALSRGPRPPVRTLAVPSATGASHMLSPRLRCSVTARPPSHFVRCPYCILRHPRCPLASATGTRPTVTLLGPARCWLSEALLFPCGRTQSPSAPVRSAVTTSAPAALPIHAGTNTRPAPRELRGSDTAR